MNQKSGNCPVFVASPVNIAKFWCVKIFALILSSGGLLRFGLFCLTSQGLFRVTESACLMPELAETLMPRRWQQRSGYFHAH